MNCGGEPVPGSLKDGRRRLIAATTSGLMLMAVACSGSSTGGSSQGGEPHRGGTAVIAFADPIDTWNPQLSLGQSSCQVMAQVYPSLLRIKADGVSVEP